MKENQKDTAETVSVHDSTHIPTQDYIMNVLRDLYEKGSHHATEYDNQETCIAEAYEKIGHATTFKSMV